MNRRKIKADLEECETTMRFLNRYQEENYAVETQKGYLCPPIWAHEVLPMNHSQGLFAYYRDLSIVLEFALKEGFIPKEILPIDAPEYLEEIVG